MDALGHGSTSKQRRIFLWVSAVVAIGLMIVAHHVMLPFVLALVVAYVLTPAVKHVERLRIPRWGSILIVYAVTLGGIALFVSQIVPRLVSEARGLATEWPKLQTEVRENVLPKVDARLMTWSGQAAPPPVEVAPDGAPPAPPAPPVRVARREDGSFDVEIADGVQFRETSEGVWRIEQVERRRGISSARILREGFDRATAYLKENSFELLKIGQQVVGAISRGIFNLFMTLMLGAYLILTHERIIAFFRELWAPGTRDSFDRLLRRLDRGLAGVVRGQLLICLVNGVLSAVGFWLFDLKYWPLLAIVAGVMSLIPIFGSILSSIPAVAIGLTQSFGTAFGVLAWIVGIHQLEANFLNPKIIGDAAKIHPVLVVFSLLVGEHFFQIPGALFAVPCMSIAQTIFLHFRESTMGLVNPLASIPPPPPGRSSSRTPVVPPPPPTPPSEEDRPPDSSRAARTPTPADRTA